MRALALGSLALLLGCAGGGVREVAAGLEHACELTQDGTVRCWGSDAHGAIGRRTASGVGRPGVVGVPAARAIGAGGRTTCVVDGEGALHCLGQNDRGQIGDGTREDAWRPVRVAELPPVVDVAVGLAHACARTEAGEVYCWGANDAGQAAPGAPIEVDRPLRVEAPSPARAVIAGHRTSCAIDTDDVARCWGEALGPEELEGVRALALGERYLCAVRADEVRCFGVAPGTDEASPSEGVAHPLDGGALAAGGIDHACLTDARGRARCFGQNDLGVLGDGTFVSRAEPTAVHGLGLVSSLAVGARHSCAVSGGLTFCWGWNDRGQLGREGAHSLLPEPVR